MVTNKYNTKLQEKLNIDGTKCTKHIDEFKILLQKFFNEETRTVELDWSHGDGEYRNMEIFIFEDYSVYAYIHIKGSSTQISRATIDCPAYFQNTIDSKYIHEISVFDHEGDSVKISAEEEDVLDQVILDLIRVSNVEN